MCGSIYYSYPPYIVRKLVNQLTVLHHSILTVKIAIVFFFYSVDVGGVSREHFQFLTLIRRKPPSPLFPGLEFKPFRYSKLSVLCLLLYIMSFIIIILLLVSKLGLNTVICDWYWNQLLGLVSQWLQKHTLGWRPNHQSGTILDLFLPLTKSIYCDPDLPEQPSVQKYPKKRWTHNCYNIVSPACGRMRQYRPSLK